MVLLGTVLRLSDGLPLSESTENSSDPCVVQAKKVVKCLSPILQRSTSRICVQEDEYTIHASHNSNIAVAVAVAPQYPHLLAHGYLDAVQRRFCGLHSAAGVQAVRRPHAFTEFNNFLSSTARQFADHRTAASKFNITAMRDELNQRPLTYLTAEEVLNPRAAVSRGLSATLDYGANAALPLPDYSKVSCGVQLRALQHHHTLTLAAAALLTLLDLYRAIILSTSHAGDDDHSVAVICFVLEAFLLMSQSLLLLRYQRFRVLLSLFSLLLLGLSGALLLSPVREAWLSLSYGLVSAALFVLCVKRHTVKKLGKFNV